MSGPVYDDPIAHPGGMKVDLVPHDGVCAYCGRALGTLCVYDYQGLKYCCHDCLEANRLVKDVSDGVISPPHYTSGGIETIDFIKAKLTPDEFRGYLKGSVIKYLSRANLKGNEEQDYRKASFYSRMLAGDDPRGEAE